MPTEVELKFLNIDRKDIEHKIRSLGAKKRYHAKLESVHFRVGDRMLRVRKIGKKVFLTCKGRKLESDFHIREELEMEVGDFKTAIAMIESLGFRRHLAYVKDRTHYELGDVHFEIDQFKGEKPYLEIETGTVAAMHKICKELGLDITKGTNKVAPELFPHLFKEKYS